MNDFSQEFGWLFLVGIFLVSYIFGLLWQAIMQNVWGGKIIKEISNGRMFYFKTKNGEYRLESTHKKFSFKLKNESKWTLVDYDDIKDIHILTSTDTASLIEFFLGDWGLWDMFGKYRDFLHTYSIQVLLKDQRIIPIMELKQYEQREWLLGQLFLKLSNWILKIFKMYRQGDEVAEEALEKIAEKFKRAGCDIQVRPTR